MTEPLRRGGTLLLAAVLTACGGGAADTTTTTGTTSVPTTTMIEAGFEVTSEDGNLTVTVPVSAASSDPGITIAQLDPAEFPVGLEGLAPEAALRGFDLGPDGHEFNGPVTVTLHIDAVEFTDLAPNEVPVLVLFTTDAAGGFIPLDDLEVTRRGAAVLVSGTTTHFSPVLVARESTTATVTLTTEDIENSASMRSVDSIIQLMSLAPGVIPVWGGVRDSSGASVSELQPDLTIDGLPSIAGYPMLITCDEVAEVEVLKVTNTVEFGPDPIAGVVDLLVTGELFSPTPFDIKLSLSGRARCLDSAGSIILTELSGLELITDHPAGETFVPDENFLGGLSALLARLDEQSSFVGLYGGLICDNNGNRQVDAFDTMFPAFPLSSVGNRYQLVVPLFDFADYFVYFVDESLFFGLPTGSSWTVEQGLSAYESMFGEVGPRFEASIGLVEVDGTPFVYNVGPSEGSLAVPGAKIGMFDSLRTQF